ncbi:hypothetical protein AHF37_03853 [Paragonimus kellicotti]|nr:hypothetical protein AHF37_03853 [Paragonimus kellicotti]
MGRAMMHDCGKAISTYGGNLNKRALFGAGTSGNVASPSFGDVATLCASGYNSRPGSSQHNGELLGPVSGGFSMRSAYPSVVEANSDNVSFFNSIGYNGGQAGPARNFSEPSLFPSLTTISRTVGTDLSGGRIAAVNSCSAKPPNDALSIGGIRNSGSLFNTSLANDAGVSNTTNLTSSSSRGVKLDPSEFPPILTSVGRSTNTSLSGAFHSSANQPPLRNYLSAMSKGSIGIETNVSQLSQPFGHAITNQVTPPEFSKQDFPALPGQHSTNPNSTTVPSGSNTLTATSSTLHRSMAINSISTNSSVVGNTLSTHRSFAQSTSLLNSPSSLNASGFSSTSANNLCVGPGIQLLPNHLVANIPKNMICDQFGMLGLLKLIRVGDYDATLNMLAPGLDLSSLHNNWQTPGELHNTFVSPCQDSCIGRPQDMDYAVPSEYFIRHLIADRLPDPRMNQLSEETLFWLFYNCCREEAQLVVAKELLAKVAADGDPKFPLREPLDAVVAEQNPLFTARSASTAAGSSVTPSISPATTTGVTSMAANTLASTSPNGTNANSTSGSSNVVDLAVDSDVTLSRMTNSLSIADAGGVQPVFENARL